MSDKVWFITGAPRGFGSICGMPVVRAAFAERLAHWEAWEASDFV